MGQQCYLSGEQACRPGNGYFERSLRQHHHVFRIKGVILLAQYGRTPTLLTNSQAQPPAIVANDATSVAGTTATANGDLLSYDADQPNVSIFYGPTSYPCKMLHYGLMRVTYK